MIDVIKTITTSSSPLSLRVSDGKIFVLTNDYTLLVFNKENFDLEYSKKISTKHEMQEAYENSFDISSNLDIFLTLKNAKNDYILKYNGALKNIAQVKNHDKPISCAVFNNNATILATGCKGGKLFLYSLQDNKTIKSFNIKMQNISNITFSEDDKFIAVSSLDKKTVIYSCSYAQESVVFESDSVVKKAIFTERNSKLVVIKENKKLVTFDLATQLKTELSIEFEEELTTLNLLRKNFFLVGTKSNKLYLIDSLKETILATIPLKNSGISVVNVDEDRIYISFSDATVYVVDMQSGAGKFLLNLKLKKFAEADKQVEQNIFLLTHESAKKYDEDWAETLSKAKRTILLDKEEEARALVAPFFFDKTKEEEFEFCHKHIKEYDTFLKHIEDKKYIDAFKIADEFEFLRKTKEYDAIEKHYIKTAHNCKLLLAKDDQKSREIAIKVLQGYATIKSKEKLVNSILQHYQTIIMAEEFVARRDFKLYFRLVAQNKFLEDEEIYERVIMIGNNTYNKLNLAMQKQEYDKALELAEYLKHFLAHKAHVEKIVDTIEKQRYILKGIEDNRPNSIYSLVQKEPELHSFAPFVKFHDEFLKLLRKAREFSLKGEVETLHNMLGKYINIEYTVNLLAQEFKLAYLTQIEKYKKSKEGASIDWNRCFELYDSMFGIDNEITLLARNLSFEDELKEVKSVNRHDGYKKIKFLESIFD